MALAAPCRGSLASPSLPGRGGGSGSVRSSSSGGVRSGVAVARWRQARGPCAPRAAAAAAEGAATAAAAAAAADPAPAAPVAASVTAAAASVTAAGAGPGGFSLLGLSAGALFGGVSALMVPVYFCMAGFSSSSRRVRAALLDSPALYVGLALLHGAVMVAAWQAGLGAALTDALAPLADAVASAGGTAGAAPSWVEAAARSVAGGARAMGAPLVTLAAWLHLLCLDALMAREIALDGLRCGVATAHSVALCFFFGPTGLIAHALTRWASSRRARGAA